MSVGRKYLAHYLDAAFDTTYSACEYVRLGDDLEEYSIELNPEVETKKNILGENSVHLSGYEVSSSVDPYYFAHDDKLSEKLMDIAMTQTDGEGVVSSTVDVLLKKSETDDEAPTVVWAYRTDCVVAPQSVGGDTTGIQIPFEIHRKGNRVKGTFDITTKKFTPNEL